MSSHRAASTASNASTTVELGSYLDRVYEQNRKEAEEAYANHMIASRELHDAEMRMMTAKRAIRSLNDELTKATATAAAATELVDRKRKAADSAAADFKFTSEVTRGCYGTEGAKRIRSAVSPVYHAVSPVYSEKVVKRIRSSSPSPAVYSKLKSGAKVVEIEQESQDPYGGGDTPSYNPTSPSYVPQRPEGDGNSPPYRSPVGHCRITGEPIYSPSEFRTKTPSYAPTSPNYSATTPKTPSPLSPHSMAAAKRATLRWGA